jgi:Flp pilus assembly protein TadG
MILRASRSTPPRRGHAAQALAEFALVLPIFLVMLMILMDLGRVIYAQNAITQDAHAATRFASVEAPQTTADIISKAKIVSPAVDYPDSAITGEGGLWYPDGTAEGKRVVVQIELQVPLLTPIVSTIVGGSITVTARSEELIRSAKP